MRAFSIDRKTFIAITWLLTGALFVGCWGDLLSVKQGFAICAELNTLEFDGEDDDRNEVRCLDFALSNGVGHFVDPQTWRLSPFLYCVQGSQRGWRPYSERAPPVR